MRRCSNRRAVKSIVMTVCSQNWITQSEILESYPAKNFSIWIRILQTVVEPLSTPTIQAITRKQGNAFRIVKAQLEVAKGKPMRLSFLERKFRSWRPRKRPGRLRLTHSSNLTNSGKTFSLRCRLWIKWTTNNLFRTSKASWICLERKSSDNTKETVEAVKISRSL